MTIESWIVYRHTSPSGKVYIGITSDLKSRWANNGYNYSRYNSIFKKAIEKYGWDNILHEILLNNCTKSEAIYAEKYLIRWYKIHNISYNVTDGGEGTWGRKDSQETILKKSIAKLGKKLTKERILKLKESHLTERVQLVCRLNLEKAHRIWKGLHHSEETRRKMSEKAKGRDMSKAILASLKSPRKKLGKAIILLDKNNNIINEFSSITNAAKNLNIKRTSISECLSGRNKTAGGFRWKYKK